MVEGEDGAAAVMAGCSVELRLVVPDPRFDLSKAVCSHGLFMMAPNCWLPAARSLLRPLRLASSPSTSLPVRISQPSPSAPLLIVSVYGAAFLSADDQEAILGQVRRMLRISDENDRVIREFHQLHAGARDGGFGRVFRSPTLFEDMVKCILLCNCQWPRTLSMAKALCDLQLELKRDKTLGEVYPKTPPSREPKRKRQKKTKVSLKLENKLTNREADLEDDVKSVHGQEKKCNEMQDDNVSSNILLDGRETYESDFALGLSASKKVADNVLLQSDLFGDFPSPQELADVDVKYLAKRCKLGYRAQRIISLAQDIVKHKIRYNRLKEICDGCTISAYDDLDKELSCISGFGPFTRANVLMCMGFYHKIPSDTETRRHLKQFHSKHCCTGGSLEGELEKMYGKYSPFQFLAYWYELWTFYEERFGKTAEMASSDYLLITKCNMKEGTVQKVRFTPASVGHPFIQQFL